MSYLNIRDAYDHFGGNFSDVSSRLMGEDRVEKYLKLFLQDTLMSDIETSYAAGDFEAMFRASHTMKGNSQTLGLGKLNVSSVKLTEALRANDHANLDALVAQVRSDYQEVLDAFSA